LLHQLDRVSDRQPFNELRLLTVKKNLPRLPILEEGLGLLLERVVALRRNLDLDAIALFCLTYVHDGHGASTILIAGHVHHSALAILDADDRKLRGVAQRRLPADAELASLLVRLAL